MRLPASPPSTTTVSSTTGRESAECWPPPTWPADTWSPWSTGHYCRSKLCEGRGRVAAERTLHEVKHTQVHTCAHLRARTHSQTHTSETRAEDVYLGETAEGARGPRPAPDSGLSAPGCRLSRLPGPDSPAGHLPFADWRPRLSPASRLAPGSSCTPMCQACAGPAEPAPGGQHAHRQPQSMVGSTRLQVPLGQTAAPEAGWGSTRREREGQVQRPHRCRNGPVPEGQAQRRGGVRVHGKLLV